MTPFQRFKQFGVGFYLLLLVFLHMNAILKVEDPIADTQTDAISYDQKMEQDKDGVKAPASPRIIYYGGQGFLGQSSVSKYEDEISEKSGSKKKETFNWSDWWEDKPADSQPDESAAQTTETLPVSLEEDLEPVPADQFDDGNLESDQPKTDESAKAGDDWW